ncbi:MAG: MarR family transcriptional regulator [Clostridiales bacterium]|jgi:DNA-binding MarR family transcriptional regulator|nr:MarR family transcriptional regulator [Clostridiales bacterium]
MDGLKLENQLCFPLYAASREVIKQYAPHLEEIGLTYTQYIVMMVLWEHRQIGAKQLGELLFLDSGTITPVVKKLEQMGFLSRSRGTEDERTMNISLSKEGEKLREHAVPIPSRVAKCLNLNPEEAAVLYKLLYKMLGNFKRQRDSSYDENNK